MKKNLAEIAILVFVFFGRIKVDIDIGPVESFGLGGVFCKQHKCQKGTTADNERNEDDYVHSGVLLAETSVTGK